MEKKVSSAVSDRMRIVTNRKVQLGVIALLMLLVVIFLFSFIPYTISKDRLTEPSFITDLLMVCAITILAMVGMVFIGQAGNAQNSNSKVAKASREFKDYRERVIQKGVTFFKQWVVQVLQKDDIQIIKERALNSLGVEDLNVLQLDVKQIENLNQPQKFKFTTKTGEEKTEFFQSLTPKQIKQVIKLKTRGVKINFVDPEYWINVKGITDIATRSERSLREGERKRRVLISSVASKLMVTIAFAVVMALFIKDTASGDYTSIEIATKLFSRLTAFFTSAFMGYLVGCQINDIDAEYINMRISVHLEFLEDDTFKGKTLKELAKDEYIERVKEEQVLKIEHKEVVANE